MNRKTKANLLIAMGLLPLLTTAQGSFAKRNLLSSLTELQRRGYRILVLQTRDNKDRVHIEVWNPQLTKRLGQVRIYPAVEVKDVWNPHYLESPTYRVESGQVDKQIRGLGKALYFATLLWVTERGYWLGGDRTFHIRPAARRVYNFWKKDPNIEHTTLTELGFDQTCDEVPFRVNLLRHEPIDNYMSYVDFMDQHMIKSGIRPRQEAETLWQWMDHLDQISNIDKVKEQGNKAYEVYQKNFMSRNRDQMERLFEESPLRSVYKLKMGTYPQERKLARSMMEDINKKDWYSMMEYEPEDMQ